MIKLKRSNVLMRGVVLCGVLCISNSVTAVTLDITATFNPDSSNPQYNEFKNETPNTGYCASAFVDCKGLNIFSLSTPASFYSLTAIRPDEDNPRQNPMFKVPSEWRSISVTNLKTGESEIVELRVAGVGTTYHLSIPVDELTGGGNHHSLWKGNSWSWPTPPCLRTDVGYGHGTTFVSFWRVPEGSGVCFKQARFLIPDFRYSNLQFAYQLKTPNPLTMSSGQYVGTLNYTIGPGGDFDMGDIMAPAGADSTNLTLNFTLNVEHTLKVDIPPGGNRVELEPQGGWQSWLQNGRKPTRLFRDQNFNISASTRFKMKLECPGAIGNNCILRGNVSGLGVQLLTSVSLPHGLTDASGQTVNRRLLSRGEQPVFQPGFYVDRKPGTLHFEVIPEHLGVIIQPGQSEQFSAQVTIIWDSEV